MSYGSGKLVELIIIIVVKTFVAVNFLQETLNRTLLFIFYKIQAGYEKNNAKI